MRKVFLSLLLTFLPAFCWAQTERATLSGRVSDPTGAAVVGAEVVLTDVETNVEQRTKTNSDGLYVFTSVRPGKYRVAAGSTGFKTLIKEGLVLNVQDEIAENFSLPLGSVSETVTVNANDLHINTTDASVSTVVDRQFVENMPLNGRSFQALIAQAPGAVLVPGDFSEPGQFSFNGQRATANYVTVDGVSANIGISSVTAQNQSSAGTTAGFNAAGGTNGLVSIDAMQEFRIQTSTFAPEFGRTPGAQISIATRSGTNKFHGTLFEYFRNDVLDANDWFANRARLPRAEERQNDFGGVFGGPLRKDRTFLFFSYEGLRLRLPNTVTTMVPGANARATAPAVIQPYLASYPQPTGPDNLATNTAAFAATYSDPASIDAFSLRFDQVASSKLTLFGRYDRSPSQVQTRGGGSEPNTITISQNRIQTLTGGVTWTATPRLLNDFRFNYSRNFAGNHRVGDTFGGAALPPPDATLFPSTFTSTDSQYAFTISSLAPANGWALGRGAANIQRQLNFVDSLSWQEGSHSLKFGVDYRRLSPLGNPALYSEQVSFASVNSAMALSPSFVNVVQILPNNIAYQNLGFFAQDTWKATPRLTLTYGVRWDIDFAPHAASGPDLLAVNQIDNLATTAIAPPGTPVFETRFDNVAPRLGFAYQLFTNKNWNTVLRGGFGVFFDLSSQEISQALASVYPYGAGKFVPVPGFPIPPATAAPPPIANNFTASTLFAADPKVNLPYSWQWNLRMEQALGANQVFSATYVGQMGRRLIQTELDFPVNPSIRAGLFYRNRATSDYHALQLQFQRRLSHGLQALAGYTYSHSIDTASSNNGQLAASAASLFAATTNNRSSSDFDIRQTFTAAVTYDFPAPGKNKVLHALGRDWSVDSLVQARTAPPVDIIDRRNGLLAGSLVEVRPNFVPGQPLVISDPTVAGGSRFNPAAFINPPPGTQGNVPRNFLRAFGASQWDLAVRRSFKLKESLNLQLRAEFFNVLNHPNFAPPNNNFNSAFPNPLFGLSTQSLARNLSGGAFGTGFSPLYSIGGPRSIQLALKLQF